MNKKEFLVIRDTELTNKDEWYKRLKKRKKGNCENYTQSVNAKNRKFKQEVGDILYIYLNGVGMFNKVSVVRKEVFEITNKKELQKIREKTLQSLKKDKKYWKTEEKKIDELKENEKLFFLLLTTELEEILEEFPVEYRSYGTSFIEITKKNKEEIFELKGRKDLLKYLPDGNLGKITKEVKHELNIKYGPNTTFYGVKIKDGKSIDRDHFIPQIVGGLGNIVENILPIPASWNRSKNAKIPKSLITIAKKYFEFPIVALDNKKLETWTNWDDLEKKWYDNIEKDAVAKHEKKTIAIYITNKVIKLAEDKIRKFYCEVVKYGLLHDLKTIYPKSPYEKFDIETKC